MLTHLLGLAGYLQCRLPTLSTSLGLAYADVGYYPYPLSTLPPGLTSLWLMSLVCWRGYADFTALTACLLPSPSADASTMTHSETTTAVGLHHHTNISNISADCTYTRLYLPTTSSLFLGIMWYSAVVSSLGLCLPLYTYNISNPP